MTAAATDHPTDHPTEYYMPPPPDGGDLHLPTTDDHLNRMSAEIDDAVQAKDELLRLLAAAREIGTVEGEIGSRLREAYQQCFAVETELVGHRPWAESTAADSLLEQQQQQQRQQQQQQMVGHGRQPSREQQAILGTVIAAPLQPGGGGKAEDLSKASAFQQIPKETKAQVMLGRLLEVTSLVSAVCLIFSNRRVRMF